MKNVLQELGIPRDILDPFVGSGTTLIAARLLKRRAVGIDISRKYCEIAKERLIKESKANMLTLM